MRFHFTKKELFDIILSSTILTVAFWIFWDGKVGLTEIILGVTTGFLLHELAHKITAQLMRYEAHYKIWKFGSLIALVTAFFGVIFAAPGAVEIGPRIDLYGRQFVKKKELGLIGLAGPATNILLAGIFIGLGFYYPIFHKVVFINLFLAAFNMIPFGPLDGRKVRAWSWWVWGIVMAIIIGIALVFSKFI